MAKIDQCHAILRITHTHEDEDDACGMNACERKEWMVDDAIDERKESAHRIQSFIASHSQHLTSHSPPTHPPTISSLPPPPQARCS